MIRTETGGDTTEPSAQDPKSTPATPAQTTGSDAQISISTPAASAQTTGSNAQNPIPSPPPRNRRNCSYSQPGGCNPFQCGLAGEMPYHQTFNPHIPSESRGQSHGMQTRTGAAATIPPASSTQSDLASGLTPLRPRLLELPHMA